MELGRIAWNEGYVSRLMVGRQRKMNVWTVESGKDGRRTQWRDGWRSWIG